MEIFAQVLVAVLLIAIAAAIYFWKEIVLWANRTLFPWIHEYLPELEKPTRYAFVELDKVVTSIRIKSKALENLTNIKKAWEKLREHLLKVLVEFELNTRYEWVRRITYWVTRYLKFKQVAPGVTEIVDVDSPDTFQSNKPEVVRLVKEEILDLDSLPPDVKEEWLKRDKISRSINVTQLRDREMDEYERELKLDMTY